MKTSGTHKCARQALQGDSQQATGEWMSSPAQSGSPTSRFSIFKISIYVGCGVSTLAFLLVMAYLYWGNLKEPGIPAPTIFSASITSVKDQDAIKTAVGLLVVGLEFRDGKEHYDMPFSTGSAFSVGASGVMLTNKHVVEKFTSCQAMTTGKSAGDWKRERSLRQRCGCSLRGKNM